MKLIFNKQPTGPSGWQEGAPSKYSPPFL